MASSSSSNNMAPPRANGSSYDVFLSFRGEDTRHSFTDHLYGALKQSGILTFRDSDDAERGEELKQEIKRAIKASDASIIVVSESYATSTWCLDELSFILDQRRDCNHFVLPIFYHVDPSDVGKHRGTFEIAVNPTRRWTEENVNRWKAALTEVVGVIGMHLVGSETKFIKEVVDAIYNKLDRKQIYIPPNVTGMDARYKEILDSWLKQSEDEFLVIYGMPGSGKSTLAQYIVYSYGQHYESTSIVERIGTRCKNPHEMVTLQQQLCSDISKGKERRIHTVCQGTAQIELLLEKTKALIVLDDIVKEDQLEELLGSGNINKDSKIIITTDNDISSWFMSASKRCRVYKMKLLNYDESLELLSLHAFRSKSPKDGYKELAQQVVQYCDGNPLALRVLGSSLALKNTITSWESELSSFERSFHGDIYVVLKKSYDSLPDLEKELFLHIACFFVAQDMDYVVKILEPDYAAVSTIKTLIMRCFLYVTPENKIMMHRLLQGMGRSLVDRESRIVAERSRVWRNKDSYEMLRRKKSSMTIEGLALDIQMLLKEDGFESRQLKELSTYSLQQMDELKLLKLNFVKLTGSYEDLSVHLRWLCWVGFSESIIHTEISMGNMVALDMSYSCLKEFEPPTVLHSLKILNLKDCHNLLKIHNIDKIPNLENLILWNCHDLFHVCRTIENLERLALLNLTGCKKLSKREKSVVLEASTSGGESTQEPFFPLPHLLQRLFLNECNLECNDYFPLSFNDQSSLEYMNLGSGLFEILPSYSCLKNLRVLDLRNCKRLKRLLCLPSKLAELYIYDCTSIEKITFESGQFTLQEFGYEGCVILSEVEGFVKLVLVSKLDETDLGHMIWVKEYQNHEVFLVGDYALTKGRSCYLQMLYEFNIMSTSLPDIKHPKLTPEYTSQSTSLSFYVPSCPRSSALKGLNVTSRYTISGENMAWFAKISITNGDDLIYSPKVFGKPASGEVNIWLSYWPIGNLLEVGDEVNVAIVVMSGLEIFECGASLVYSDEDMALEIPENKMGWVETFGRDLSKYELRKGSYYLCQRDFYKLMEVGKLTPGWLSILVGDTVDDTEVRGWRMTGRPQQSYQSFTALKTVTGIIHGSLKIAEFKDEGHGNEELSVMKDRIDIIHDKIMTWEVDQYMLWDSRLDEAKEYLDAVDEIRRLIERLQSLNLTKEGDELELLTKANGVLQTSMAKIEEEFRHMLVQNRQNFEPARLSSWSTDYDGLDNSSVFSFGEGSFGEGSFGEGSFDDSTQVGSISRGFEDYIIYLVNPQVIPYLKSIANLMFDLNYGEECSQAFISVSIDALDECLYILQVDKTSIGDVLTMDWPSLNSKIRTWTKALRIFVKVYLAREKFLCEQIFGEHESVSSFCFSESSKASVLQLLSFGKAISVGSCEPGKLFRILDVYETLADLTPAIETFYPDDNGLYLRTEFQDVLNRTGDYATLIFLELKNAVGPNMSNAAVPGGGIHPLTRYIMNYIIVVIDYNSSLNTLLKDHHVADDQESPSSRDVTPSIEDDSTNENSLSLTGLHFRSLMAILECNLEEKSKLYNEDALGHLFMMNNINYMTNKVKGSELRTILGDDWIRRCKRKIQQHAMGYVRSTWSSILSLLSDEGLFHSGSVSTTLLKKRLQEFYTLFEEIYNSQTGWLIPDTQLRDELRIAESVKVIQAYRSYVGRFRSHINEKYIKYTADDIENYLLDLFEGSPKIIKQNRK